MNFFLVTDLLGCCCVYIVFVSSNMKKVSFGVIAGAAKKLHGGGNHRWCHPRGFTVQTLLASPPHLVANMIAV